MKQEEVIIISENEYSIESMSNIPQDKEDNDAFVSCIFTFKYMESTSSNCIIYLLNKIVNEFLSNFKENPPIIKYKKDAHSNLDSKENTESKCNFYIFMQGCNKNIIDFCTILSNELPLSMYFIFISLENVDSVNIDSFTDFNKNVEFKNLIPSIKDLQNIKQNYNNITNFITIKNKKLDSKQNIQEIINHIAQKLLQDSKVNIIRDNISFTLSLKKINEDSISHIMFADLYNVISYLKLSDTQKSIIATFEKPFILLQCKGAFSKELCADNYNRIFASLPFDCFFVVLFATLQKDFLFIKINDKQENTADISYKQNYTDLFTNNIKIVMSSNSNKYVYCKYIKEKHDIFDILHHNKKEDSKRFIIHLSLKNNSLFWLENLNENNEYNEILNISFDTCLQTHLMKLYTYTNGDKLLKNFAKVNEEIVKSWNLDSNFLSKIAPDLYNFKEILRNNLNKQDSNISNNLTDIFSLIKKLLNLDKDVLEYAIKCVRDRGPRIDYKLKRNGDSIVLDYPRILRSALSFYLAGVENELICYGVVESLCEFLGTLCADMLVNYGVKECFISGDLLLHQVFLDKVIYAMPKNVNLILPNEYGVDYE